MNEISILNYNNQSIRQTVTEDGEILFCAKDVAQALDYRDAEKITRVLDDDDAPQQLGFTDTTGRTQEMLFINEYQLYAILTALRTDRTKPFRRWVTHEVLPSIRKTGSYNVNGSLKLLNNLPESIKTLAQEFSEMKAEIEELKPLAEARKKTLKQRDTYNADPKRKYDVEVRYSNGKTSWIRTLPPDVAVFLQRLHSPSEVGKILEEASAVQYIRNTVMPRYNRKHKGKKKHAK